MSKSVPIAGYGKIEVIPWSWKSRSGARGVDLDVSDLEPNEDGTVELDSIEARDLQKAIKKARKS